MKIFRILFKFTLITSFLLSCGYNNTKKNQEDNKGTQNSIKPPADGQKIDFALVKKYSLTTCLNCHSGKKSPDLSQLAVIQQKKDLIWHEVDSRSMPPASSGYQELSGCPKELLRKWIDLGAPESSDVLVSEVSDCKSDQITPPAGPIKPPKPPPPDEVTPILLMPMNYKSLTDRILKPKCLLCHSEKGEQSDMPFYPYESLMILDRLWSAPAKNSKVFKEISNSEDGMPPADSKISPLSADEIEFIRRWIDAGKPEK